MAGATTIGERVLHFDINVLQRELKMQVKELKKEGLSCQYEVTVTAQDIDAQVDVRLQEVGETISLPGFRKGKVPLKLLKQKYGRSVMAEVIEKVVNDGAQKLITEKNLRPALQPKFEVTSFDEGKDLTYTMAVELLPEFKVTDVKAIKLVKPVVKADKKEIDETLERIAKSNAEYETITESRPTKKGDVIVMDFHGRTAKDNKPHPGMHAHAAKLELGSGQFIPGFEDQLVGKSVGDKVEVKVTFPEAYHAAELSGQDAIFDVEIHEIQVAKDATVNDDFAKKLGLDSEQALRDLVEKQIQSQYDDVSRMKLKRSLLDALDDAHDFELPQGMLDLEYNNILSQVRIERQGDLKDGKLELTTEEEDELRAIAARRVRLGLVLSEIGRENNIQITDQEMQRAVIMEAQRFPGQEGEVFEYYRKNRQALEALRAPVFEDKVVDFLFELADVSEKTVTVEDLTKEDDTPYTGKKAEKAKKKA